MKQSSKQRSPRCLLYYPWNLQDRTGAFSVLLSYARAMRQIGFRLDCFAPHPRGLDGDSAGSIRETFDNLFAPPRENPAILPALEFAARLHVDAELPMAEGRNETAMAAAGLLASLADYDVVGIHYTRCHTLRRLIPCDVRTVLFVHDLDSVVARQEQAVLGLPANYSLEEEAGRMRPFDLVTVFGPEDMRRLHRVAPELNLVEAPFCVGDLPRKQPRDPGAGVLLWISAAASFHVLSFSWFWEFVWPRIRSARPAARLLVAGQISRVAQQLNAGSDRGVSIHGVVDDPEILYDQADVLVAPYYYGAGLKTKIIDALGRGLPVVTTTPGLSNTRLTPDRELLVADDAAGFAGKVLSLLDSSESRSRLAAAGLEYVQRWHDPATAYAPFQAALLRILDGEPRPATASAPAGFILGESLRYLVPWAVHRCLKAGFAKVALYGAGSHTQLLIPAWAAHGGPRIETIVVSSRGGATDCMGLPVVAAEDFDPGSVDAIVLSSQGFETEMEDNCRRLWPRLPVVTIWRPPILMGAAQAPSRSDPTGLSLRYGVSREKIPPDVLSV